MYYRHWTNKLVYTLGVKELAEEHGAYWLIDAIASYQGDKRIKGNQMLQEIQFWNLTVKDGRGELVCVEDSGRPPIIKQDFEFTDFPAGEVKLYVEMGSLDGVNPMMVMMMPSER